MQPTVTLPNSSKPAVALTISAASRCVPFAMSRALKLRFDVSVSLSSSGKPTLIVSEVPHDPRSL
ncbi:hypothetical protein CN065_13880 [Sinorhizobium meliloti]|uniref:hypothetical protein n=1 Tax=Rhizobium meliloti TaxID=382 RepID=UPI000FD95F85|nr:hypothetical protein [Sinorhizobium meliloti]MQV66227.1 hypothetical protein [Sinorhizobium meliloti]RVQ39287.1 hypothetical protein CN065_13880 [Sinorhizobium meliloti]